MPFPNFLARLHKPPPRSRAKLLVVVEGRRDVVFLLTLSRVLHAADSAIPDLGVLESASELVFLPFGGGDVLSWADRLAAIGLPELHIYDRERSPETELRQQAADLVELRQNCRAFVSQKRSMENYIHPSCIRGISGLELAYGDDDDVAELVARGCHARLGSRMGIAPWPSAKALP